MDVMKLYSDRTAYPDEMTIEVQGEKMSLKEWRDSLGLKSEFTKHTQTLSEKQRQAEQALQQREAQLQQMQAQLAMAMQRQGVDPRHAQDDDLAAYRSDPAFGPLVKMIEKQEQVIGSLAQRVQNDELAVNSRWYQQQLDSLKSKDPDLNPQDLAKFTTEFYQRGPDLDSAYKLYTYDKTLKAREAEAEKRGYEKARSEPPAPPMPGRGRGRGGAPSEIELPKDLNKRADMALADPQVIQELNQGLAEWSQGR